MHPRRTLAVSILSVTVVLVLACGGSGDDRPAPPVAPAVEEPAEPEPEEPPDCHAFPMVNGENGEVRLCTFLPDRSSESDPCHDELQACLQDGCLPAQCACEETCGATCDTCEGPGCADAFELCVAGCGEVRETCSATCEGRCARAP